MAGGNDVMISLERIADRPYHCDFGTTPLVEVAGLEKTVPREFMNPAGTMVTSAFKAYALPLIDGPLPPLARLLAARAPDGEQRLSAQSNPVPAPALASRVC